MRQSPSRIACFACCGWPQEITRRPTVPSTSAPGRSIKAWGFYRRQAACRRPKSAAAVMERVGMSHVQLMPSGARSVTCGRAWKSTSAASARAMPWTGRPSACGGGMGRPPPCCMAVTAAFIALGHRAGRSRAAGRSACGIPGRPDKRLAVVRSARPGPGHVRCHVSAPGIRRPKARPHPRPAHRLAGRGYGQRHRHRPDRCRRPTPWPRRFSSLGSIRPAPIATSIPGSARSCLPACRNAIPVVVGLPPDDIDMNPIKL